MTRTNRQRIRDSIRKDDAREAYEYERERDRKEPAFGYYSGWGDSEDD